MITLTYGELPSREQFNEEWNREMDGEYDSYDIRTGMGSLFHLPPYTSASFDRDELWDLLTSSVEADRYLDECSGVLYTLNIEWI